VKRTIVEPASKPKAEYRDWDSRYPEAVAALISEMEPLPSFLKIEHVGSTAVPHCGGKGILDLLALYKSDQLDATRNYLIGMGFGSQGREFTRAWPAERPMLLGSFDWGGDRFLIYIHIVHEASDEVRRFREFRDRLRQEPRLAAKYCATKRRIVSEGVIDTDEYAAQKRSVIHEILGDAHTLKSDARPDHG
jgi:GrpB-like predicted nucleotidyltransferase (UPF0157 family)